MLNQKVDEQHISRDEREPDNELDEEIKKKEEINFFEIQESQKEVKEHVDEQQLEEQAQQQIAEHSENDIEEKVEDNNQENIKEDNNEEQAGEQIEECFEKKGGDHLEYQENKQELHNEEQNLE